MALKRALILAWALTGCAGSAGDLGAEFDSGFRTEADDGGPASPVDSGRADAGEVVDAGVVEADSGRGADAGPFDAGPAAFDAGRDGSHSADAGPATDAGRPTDAGVVTPPTQLSDLPPGHWLELPNTRIRSVLPGGQNGNPANLVGAWSGGAVDTRRNRLLVWGGGHNDYWGNEVYALDLMTLTIGRVTDPSPDTGASDCQPELPDGTPVSRHTYDGLTYVPDQDEFFSVGGAMAPCGSADLSTWTLDLQTGGWNRRIAKSPLTLSYGFMAIYDEVTKSVLVKDREGFFSYSVAENTYTQLNTKTQDVSLNFTAALDTKRRQFVMVGDSSVLVIDLATNEMRELSTTHLPAGPTAQSPGVEYDPVADRIVVWHGGSDVFALDLDTLDWSQVALNAGPTEPAQSTGTFGRWGYVPALGVFALINDIDQNAWVFRLAGGRP